MRILLVEDDPLLMTTLILHVNDLGHEAVPATNALAAQAQLEQVSVDAVITDVQMPKGSGIDLLQIQRDIKRTPPTYVHSSEPTYRVGTNVINLATFVNEHYGNFASFKLKGPDMLENIEGFLRSIEAA